MSDTGGGGARVTPGPAHVRQSGGSVLPYTMLTTEEQTQLERLEAHCAQVLSTLIRKRRDYGTANINTTGLDGIAVRMVDKAARLYQLTRGDAPAEYEPRRDTLEDIIGYALIGLILEGEQPW